MALQMVRETIVRALLEREGWEVGNEMKNLLIDLFITALTGFFAALGVAAALLLLSLFV